MLILNRLPCIGRSQILHGNACQDGLTMVELLIATSLGLVVVLLSTSIFISSKSSYIALDESVALHEGGRHAVEIISRAVHQAAYENWDGGNGGQLAEMSLSPSVLGLEAHRLSSTSVALESPLKNSVNGSDVLALRFFGAGEGAHGDETILNCAGFGVPAASAHLAETDRGWSIFYVALDSTGEPELRCKYKGKNSWTSVAIVRGVESFQVLYGIDLNKDGMPNQYVRASEIAARDEALILQGSDAAALALDKNRKTFWKHVVTVKVALLIRGMQSSRTDELDKRYELFGHSYSNLSAQADEGVSIHEKSLPIKTRNRMRKLFSATIRMRNRNADRLT